MKNTRKAAAIWLAMSLAISTAFGNTAWGEIRPDTGNNRCVHVHTAECYKDADETATPSQIGKEPTECTHICSVESGCIWDTEKENSEKADTLDAAASNTGKNDSKKEQAGEKAADRKDSSGNADGNKDLNDVPAQNGAALPVSTPSNAKDTTTTGGTVTPVSQTKILSWSWFDPEENLLDGRLELTGITEEAQPSFTEITEYLPTAIIARVEKGKDGENVEDGEEKNLLITNWSCPEYVQDEEGCWPLEGTYEFKAELPEGYELAEGVDALVVEVAVVGDQAAVTAGEMRAILTVIRDGKVDASVYDNGEDHLTSANISGLTYQNLSNGNHKLILNNTNVNSISIHSGNWTIELRGKNKAEVDRKYLGTAFFIGQGAEVVITGDGSLTTAGNLIGSGIDVVGKLTIQRGTINASANEYKGNKADDARIAGIRVSGNGELHIVGGSITTTGSGRYGVFVGGTFRMSGGELTANGVGHQAILVDGRGTAGTFELSGGIIRATENNGTGFAVASDNVTIKGGKLIADRVLLDNRTMTIESGGTLEVDRLGLKETGKLVNKGKLIVNGDYDGGGTVVTEEGGTISGTGSVPEDAKRDPGSIRFTKGTLKQEYTSEKMDIQGLAEITKPNENVELSYSIDKDKSDGIGTINSGTGKLTVEKIGTFVIQVTTEKTGIYKSAEPVEITLTVTPAKIPESWKLEINPIRDVTYNGSTGYKVATVTARDIPSDVKVTYEYQVARTTKIDELPADQWQQTCPTIANVAESGQHVFVRVITDNYEPKVFSSFETTEIKKRTFSSSVTVTIEPDALIYNGKPQMPKIKVVENWDGALKNELRENVDYKISYWGKKVSGGIGSVIKDSEIKDAGTYTVQLMGIGNYDNTTNGAIFTIQKSTLFLKINGSTTKVYDGTVGVTDAQNLAIQLAITKEGTSPFDEIYVDHVEWEYNYADVGKRVLTAHDIKIAGPNAESYQLESTSVSDYGWIEKRDFASMTVSAAPLTYNGTEQQPKINASVETGLENVSPDATFTYSKDGVNYQSEIPGFTEAGTYLVYVKASMANFNDETKTVAVTVQKAAAPTVSAMSESYSYKETGERQVALPGFPEDCGTIGSITAQIISDEGQILDSAAVDGMNLVLRLKGSSKNMVGKTAQVVVKVETKNYEDIQIPVIVTLTADSSDSNSNNNSGNNSGNNGSNNGNSNGSSSSDGDSSDYDDPNESSVKVTPNPSNKVTKDSQKGYRNVEQGVITGTANQTVNDGYSHWMKDAKGWWLRFSDGTWPMADRTGAYHWEKINGRWWAFDETGYAKTGWLRDEDYGGWFYIDPEHGMQTGWVLLDGVWYYFNPISDGKRGIMYAGQRTPDGYYVDKNGVWDGRNKQ